MNAVVIAVTLMLVLSLARMHVMLAMIVAAFVGGWVGGLDLHTTLEAFNAGIGGGAGIALSYALLGGFAVAISMSGLPHLLADAILRRLGAETGGQQSVWLRNALLGLLLAAAVSSQNLIPIHIAFIPILVPPLLMVMAKLQLDRRLVACVLTFGLVTPYMFLPVGFGNIYLNEILLGRVAEAGLDIQGISVVHAMAIQALAVVALVGTAGALGDAGSPASDSTLGPTAGLNADGQHHHMRDTVIPTFLHFNLPLLAAGWIAAMVL